MYNDIPENYKPLGAWAYFGWDILFNLPLVGFILLIVFSFNNSNINRRNYARSYFIKYIIAFIIVIFFAGAIFSLINYLI